MNEEFEIKLKFDIDATIEYDGVNEEDLKEFQKYLKNELSWYVTHHMADIVEGFYTDKERGAI